VYADERQHRILRSARETGSVGVTQLAAELSVAAETIRRDLRELERNGLVRRTHGGAHPVETARLETTLAVRATRGVPESSGSRPRRWRSSVRRFHRTGRSPW
jgi:DeoR/GlpR family transcriptional regulator of sugar metabolism